MKHILLNQAGDSYKYYRANLHCHSTFSDGAKTPEQLKKFYMDHGYSVIAYTDHSDFHTHNELTDENFVALNGYEIGADGPKSLCHLCFIAYDPENCAEKYPANGQLSSDHMVYDGKRAYYNMTYSAENLNEVMRIAKKSGFFITYNHPIWSIESYPEYMGYDEMDALEIVNYSSYIYGYDDDNGHCYEDMLRGHKRVNCVASDDNHNHMGDDTPYCDSFGGYTMIGADKLDYASIAKSLKEGKYYCCYGSSVHNAPEIYYLEYEDKKVRIKTSAAKAIFLMPEKRSNQVRFANYGETITEAEFDIGDQEWFRLVVTDETGAKTYTNGYYPADFEKQ